MSRLSRISVEYRDRLLSKSLYNPENIYDLNNPRLIQAINIISNQIINPGNSFDFTNTIFGRIIGPQTPLSIIGRNQLLIQKSFDIKNKLRTRLVPTIKLNGNANSFNNILLIQKNVDYTITKSKGENILDSFRNAISTFTTFSQAINPIESKLTPIDSFIYNNKLLLENTGDGQLFQLTKNLSSNVFYPNYDLDIRNDSYIENRNILNNSSNAFNTFKTIFNLNQLNIPFVKPSNITYDINTIDPTLRRDLGGIQNVNNIEDISQLKPKSIDDDKSLYGLTYYTKQLFNALGNKNPNNVKRSSFIDINGNTHFRGSVFNNNNQDNQYNNQSIKNPKGYTDKKFDKSVMFNSSQPKIVGNGDQNLFFSIENLAVSYDSFKYPIEQRGRFGGRFMWFNPYIVNINETSTPEITSTKFIGRSEPVYTYASNERSLTISFKLVVDYDENLLKVNDYNSYLNYIYKNQIANNLSNTAPKKNNPKKEDVLKKDRDQLTKNKIDFIYDVGTIPFKFNKDEHFININLPEIKEPILRLVDKIISYEEINPNSRFRIEISGYSSINSDENFSEDLAIKRGDLIYNAILAKVFTDRKKYYDFFKNNIDYNILPNVNNFQDGIINYNSSKAIQERTGFINNVFLTSSNIVQKDGSNVDESIIKKINEDIEDIIENTTETENDTLLQIIQSRLNNNFDQIGSGTFNKIKNKIISPGLISYSPRDMYDRLTFLNQCTRQGETIDVDPNTISNSVFGKPPVIVIRIGDMYYSKAIINQLTIDFTDQNTWDLNNSGMGVQFMSCDIVLSMKLMGGSTIDGPTKHILNADSRSYYANSSFEENKIDNKYLDNEQKILENK